MQAKKNNLAMTEEITQLRYSDIEVDEMDYADDNIAFHRNFSELPIDKGTLRIDMYLLAACVKGRMSVEMNNHRHEIGEYDIIVSSPNSVLTNYMTSPDFEGAVLCLSKKAIMECFPENDLLDKVIYLIDNPIVKINKESATMMHHMMCAVDVKLRSKNTQYKKQVMLSLVKAAICEILSNVVMPEEDNGGGSRQSASRDELFKQFLKLLTETRVKPRSMEWYAQRLCVTPKYLSAVCKQSSGKTAYRWITEFVVKDIVYWLRNSSRSIKEISVLLDFPNESFFGKYCREHLGMSPSKYRQTMNGE